MRMSGSGFEFNVDPIGEQLVIIAHGLHCSDIPVDTFYSAAQRDIDCLETTLFSLLRPACEVNRPNLI